jgi:hypothetical protein
MRTTDTRLLFAPYRAPALAVGARTTCLYRGCTVIVTGWTTGPISWPLCRRSQGRGRSSLLVDDELLRAIRSESAIAVIHHWRVSVTVVWRWRKAFGVARACITRNQQVWTIDQCQQHAQATAKHFGDRLQGGYPGHWWTSEELALLGTLPDDVVATRIGRSVAAVRVMRSRLDSGKRPS